MRPARVVAIATLSLILLGWTPLVLAQNYLPPQMQADQITHQQDTPRCCRCTKTDAASPTYCFHVIRGVDDFCTNYQAGPAYTALSAGAKTALQGYSCTNLTPEQCHGPGVGTAGRASALCPVEPVPSLEELGPQLSPADAAPPPPPFASITPSLSVPIPGLKFGSAHQEDGYIVIPFLAQYINAAYRYGIGLSVVAAIVMTVYGGFLYLIGSAIGDVQRGKEIIRNALMGMVILLSAYTLLNTINPATLSLDAIKIAFVQPVSLGELEHSNDETITAGNSGLCASGPGGAPSALKTGQRVINLHGVNYTQYQAPWGKKAYGRNSDLGFQPGEANYDAAPTCTGRNEAGCITNFQASACGPTSLAVVLGYYGTKVDGHVVTPLDTGRYAVLTGARKRTPTANGGTDAGPLFSQSNLDQYFPGYISGDISHNLPAVAAALRAGQPLIFGNPTSCVKTATDPTCTHSGCTIYKKSGGPDGHQDCGGGGGHYMVLVGVSEDNQTFYIHDVGWGDEGSYKISATQVANMSFRNIHPRNMTAPPPGMCNLATAAGGGPTPAAGPTAPVRSGSVTQSMFTYRPAASHDPGWHDNYSFLMYPDRLVAEAAAHPGMRVHAYVFIHGLSHDNVGPTAADGHTEAAFVNLLRTALQGVAGDKNVVIMAPLFANDTSYMDHFDLSEFYAAAKAKLLEVMPGVTVQDVSVGGHSAATCQPGAHTGDNPLLRQAYTKSLPDQLRAVIAYDGCLGTGLTSSNFSPPDNVAVYFNSALGGMGTDECPTPHHCPPALPPDQWVHRNVLVRDSFGISQTPTACPGSVGTAAHPQCFFKVGRAAEMMEIDTTNDHRGSVQTMTASMLRALYANAASH